MSIENKLSLHNLIEIVFVVDCTGSMRPFIINLRKSLRTAIAKTLTAYNKKLTIYYGMIGYRDHSEEAIPNGLVEKFDLTDNLDSFLIFLENLRCYGGGGDGKEALADGLAAVNSLSWKEKSLKICLILSDGLIKNALECNCHLDYKKIAQDLFNLKKIQIYPIPVHHLRWIKHNPKLDTNFKEIIEGLNPDYNKFLPLKDVDSVPELLGTILEDQLFLIHLIDYYNEKDGVFKLKDCADSFKITVDTLQIAILKLFELQLISKMPVDEKINWEEIIANPKKYFQITILNPLVYGPGKNQTTIDVKYLTDITPKVKIMIGNDVNETCFGAWMVTKDRCDSISKNPYVFELQVDDPLLKYTLIKISIVDYVSKKKFIYESIPTAKTF